MVQFKSIKDRYEYLKLVGKVGETTFGYDRIFNQKFYTSREWRDIRNEVIIRDNGCDLGVEGYELDRHIIVHHMNPITLEDILHEKWEYLTNPEYLISVSYNTHQAIHFGDSNLLPQLPIERKPGDTCLWR